MKAIVVIILFAIIRSCSSLTSNSNPDFLIQTEKTSYIVSEKLNVKVTFQNNLSREVQIYNAGCGFPNFILEKLESEKWIKTGGPVCIALAVAPTKLEGGKDFEAQVSMYVENNITSGTYRMKFFIENDEHQSIDSKYLYSSSFQLIKN